MRKSGSKPQSAKKAGAARPRALARYDARRERDGTWTVFNVFSHEPPDIGQAEPVGMRKGDAKELVERLNRLHPWNDGGTIH